MQRKSRLENVEGMTPVAEPPRIRTNTELEDGKFGLHLSRQSVWNCSVDALRLSLRRQMITPPACVL